MLLVIASLAAATLFLLTRYRAPYPGSAAMKTAGCVLLATAAWSTAPLLALALALSAVGDWFLALRGERYFLHGLIAFLAAHLIYIVLFALAWEPELMAIAAAPVVVLIGLKLAVWLFTDLGQYRWPVLAYMAVIIAMAVTAILSSYPAWPLVPGTLLFMFSDACIAVRRFKNDFPFSGELTWLTYYMGQLLIFFSVIGMDSFGFEG